MSVDRRGLRAGACGASAVTIVPLGDAALHVLLSEQTVIEAALALARA